MVVRKSDFRRSDVALKSVDARRFDPFADPLERNVTAADALRVSCCGARTRSNTGKDDPKKNGGQDRLLDALIGA
jgi:hypothetical protein